MIGPTDRYKAVGSKGWRRDSATLAAPAAKGNAGGCHEIARNDRKAPGARHHAVGRAMDGEECPSISP
jgi:hypothetical protein